LTDRSAKCYEKKETITMNVRAHLLHWNIVQQIYKHEAYISKHGCN